MIIREFYETRADGTDLYRTYSDAGVMIRQIDTGVLYTDAVDIDGTAHTYEETDTPIPGEETEETELADKAEGFDILMGVSE